jgi:hypothetical protein
MNTIYKEATICDIDFDLQIKTDNYTGQIVEWYIYIDEQEVSDVLSKDVLDRIESEVRK